MGKVIRIDHPLVQHKLSMLRDKNTDTKSFRELVGELAMLMAYEVTRDFPLKEVEIETPICKCKSRVLAGKRTRYGRWLYESASQCQNWAYRPLSGS